MSSLHLHRERHLVSRIAWLRAAVLGANDGIVSTASLIIGVAAAASMPGDILIAGAAGMVAGAMAMAAGEYVSVSSQSDTERADLARERAELAGNVDAEMHELAQIYIKHGVDPLTAQLVAWQLMVKDALAAHAHDELGISKMTSARPIQAALTSATTFTAGCVSAAGDRDLRARLLARRTRGLRLASISRAAWRGRGAGGWRASLDCHDPCHILRRPGDGPYWRDWVAGRNSGVTRCRTKRVPRFAADPSACADEGDIRRGREEALASEDSADFFAIGAFDHSWPSDAAFGGDTGALPGKAHLPLMFLP